jgi:hypothetical protein
VRLVLEDCRPRKVINFSRDEFRQHEMRTSGFDQDCLRYFFGDARDTHCLRNALDGVDYLTSPPTRTVAILRVRIECDFSRMRWTADTPEDLEFIRKVFFHFRRYDFSWRDVVGLLDGYPDWLDMNRHVQQRTV